MVVSANSFTGDQEIFFEAQRIKKNLERIVQYVEKLNLSEEERVSYKDRVDQEYDKYRALQRDLDAEELFPELSNLFMRVFAILESVGSSEEEDALNLDEKEDSSKERGSQVSFKQEEEDFLGGALFPSDVVARTKKISALHPQKELKTSLEDKKSLFQSKKEEGKRKARQIDSKWHNIAQKVFEYSPLYYSLVMFMRPCGFDFRRKVVLVKVGEPLQKFGGEIVNNIINSPGFLSTLLQSINAEIKEIENIGETTKKKQRGGIEGVEFIF